MRADDEVKRFPIEQREAFWAGYICGVKTFEQDMCMERTDSSCPYVAVKVAEKMKGIHGTVKA